jgi:hypothetical protein
MEAGKCIHEETEPLERTPALNQEVQPPARMERKPVRSISSKDRIGWGPSH